MNYAYYDSKYGVHTRRCIDGSITGACRCVGYCSYASHPGFLTKDLRRDHNCVKNGCWYYTAKEASRAAPIPSAWSKAAELWGLTVSMEGQR